MVRNYEERLIIIETRIDDLKKQRNMWLKAGGNGYKMASQADQEISELEAEKTRILNGTQSKIDDIEDKISELEKLKAQCKVINFLKKRKLNNEINNYKEQQNQVLKR